jgi:hypothetical protein
MGENHDPEGVADKNSYLYFHYTMVNLSKYLLAFFISTHCLFAQTMDTVSIKNQLAFIYERDQKTRSNGDSTEFINFIDSCNLAQVELIINKYGWLGKSEIGIKGNTTLFIVIQHADLKTQQKYFPLLKTSVEKGESSASDMALMVDRILIRKKQRQIFGSQVTYNSKGQPEFYPIIDEKNVNYRRTEVGLESIEEYAERFGIEYKAP